MRNESYKCARSYKATSKMFHDKRILRKEFHPGQKVLLYNSRLHLFPGKLNSRWSGPYVVHTVHSHSAIELLNPKDGSTFQVNGHILKEYIEFVDPANVVKEVLFLDPG